MAKLSILLSDDELHNLHGLAHRERLKFQPMVRAAVLSLLGPPTERQVVPSASPRPKVLSQLDCELAVIEKRDPVAADGIRRLISMAARGLDEAKIGSDTNAPKNELRRATERAGRTLSRATGSAKDDPENSKGAA